MKTLKRIISLWLAVLLALPVYPQAMPSAPGSVAAPSASSAASLAVTTTPTSIKKSSGDSTNLLSRDGQILAGPEPNSIMVIDYPENLKQVEDYVKMVDVAPPQVLIEARVVEVHLTGESALGINWNIFANSGSGPINTGRFNIGQSATQGLAQSIPFKQTNYPPGTSSGAENPFTFTISDENISVVLQTLANNYDTTILSAPSITGVNNHPAKIEVVKSLPYATPTFSTTTTGTGSTNAPQVTWTVTFVPVGITLVATPTITDDGNIALDLHPDVSEHTSDYPVSASDGQGNTLNYTIPIVDSRTADTKAIVGNGKTLIIGGLISDTVIKGETKVPVLGDIPFLGRLFKSTKNTHDKTELLIFVSPTIITPKVVEKMMAKEKTGVGEWYNKEKTITRMLADNDIVMPRDTRLADKLAVLEGKVKKLADNRRQLMQQFSDKN